MMLQDSCTAALHDAHRHVSEGTRRVVDARRQHPRERGDHSGCRRSGTWFTLPAGQAVTQGWNGVFTQQGDQVTVTNTGFTGSATANPVTAPADVKCSAS